MMWPENDRYDWPDGKIGIMRPVRKDRYAWR